MTKKIILDFLLKQNNSFTKTLDHFLINKKAPHFFILQGNYNTDLSLLSFYLAQQLLVQETLIQIEDLIELKYENLFYLTNIDDETYKKDDILEYFANLQFSSISQSKIKILILTNAENASSKIMNALLKFIESPPPNVYIIFTVNNLAKVLKTVKSRAVIFSIHNLSIEDKKTIINKNEKIESKYVNFYLYYIDNITTLEQGLEDDVLSTINTIIDNISLILKEPWEFALILNKLIDQGYLNYVALVLRALCDNILNIQPVKIFHKTSKFIAKAQEHLSKFIDLSFVLEQYLSKTNFNLNYKIQKANFLVGILDIFAKSK